MNVLFPIIALGLTGLGYGLHRVVLTIAGALAWISAGVYAYTLSTTMWDSYYIAFWLFIGIAITTAVDSIYLLIQEQAINNREERRTEFDEKRDEREEKKHDSNEHPIDTIRKKHGLGPSEARKRNTEKRRWRLV